ncbi:hypothetical protein SAMN04487905_10542 [Actinopolyspora xinjiangensis]|uniref:Uncharacterized protein n=1 Tax=Actinopolyspora xinjiangensis TaxID=405564 RepID=A0A1H0TG36_9ACTN|nr:hypothetical protein [Actinopolyspora xinjiangensis]SDP52781.1 hypothetical protein SAMN04487905_10542 [Actinopolyspora xinjiangensis]
MNIRNGLSRLLRLKGGSRGAGFPDPDDPNLVIVVEAADETESASEVLARSPAWNPEAPAVLRYRFAIGTTASRDLRAPLEAEGWLLRTGTGTESSTPTAEPEPATLIAQCVRPIDAVTCARENSRMVGLAQRHRARLLGWQALQAPLRNDRPRK